MRRQRVTLMTSAGEVVVAAVALADLLWGQGLVAAVAIATRGAFSLWIAWKMLRHEPER